MNTDKSNPAPVPWPRPAARAGQGTSVVPEACP